MKHCVTKIIEARKNHPCFWCGESINKGDNYEQRSIIGDEIFRYKLHPECASAANKWCKDDDSDLFPEPGVCKRGSTQHK